MNPCSIPECPEYVSRRMLMCKAHWLLVPKDVQRAVWDAWRSVSQGVPTRAKWKLLKAVQRSAIGAVCRRLHFPVCEHCGCTERDACEGHCSWITPNLCSACAISANQKRSAPNDAGEPAQSEPCSSTCEEHGALGAQPQHPITQADSDAMPRGESSGLRRSSRPAKAGPIHQALDLIEADAAAAVNRSRRGAR